MTGLRVLLIDDSEPDAALIKRALGALSRPVTYERVDNATDLAAALARVDWDAFVCDWSMASFGALDALAMVHETGRDRPFVVVSGTISDEIAVSAMRAGAHDYVLKDNLTRLAPAVARELRECEGRAARRLAEAELRRQLARFKALIEKTDDLLLMIDADGLVRYATPSSKRLLGCAPDAIIGKHADDLPWCPGQTGRELSIAALLADTTHPRRVRKICGPGGDERLAEVRATDMLADPEINATVLHIVDVTERQQQDEARQQAEAKLALSEDQLRHSQKMEAIGRLAGGVAHDFNNLLSVILTYSILMAEDLPPESPGAADLQEIIRAGRRAAELTRQLLMFSRHQVMEPEIVDINAVLSNVATMCGRVLGEDIEMVTKLAPTLSRVRVDPGAVEQIIMNLVINARDAMPTGGRLVLETSQVQLDTDFAATHLGVDAGDYVMLTVSDNGIGMDRATSARIFEPFFTTKERGKGTGLGLSMVFGLVQRSGGTIWVYSELGRGTTFKIYLPAVEDAASSPHLELPPITRGGRETILLVEDEDQVRVAARAMLRRLGYNVLAASGSEEALAISQTHPGTIALLLTDVVMPHMSGPELAQRLCAQRPGMKVLCMSGYTDESVVRHGLIKGAMAFIQKPITPDSLASKLRMVLDEKDS